MFRWPAFPSVSIISLEKYGELQITRVARKGIKVLIPNVSRKGLSDLRSVLISSPTCHFVIENLRARRSKFSTDF